MNAKSLVEILLNSKIKVLIDLDDTVFDFAPYYINIVNQCFSLNLTKEQIVHYRVSNLKPLKEKNIDSNHIHNTLRKLSNKPEFTNMPLIEGFYEFYEMITNGFKDIDRVYFVTSRSADFYDDHEKKTMQNLENRGIIYNKNNLIFEHNKENIVIEKSIGLVMEDNPEILIKFNNNIYKIINNQPWNQITQLDEKLLTTTDYNNKKKIISAIDSSPRSFRINNYKIFL